MTHCPGCLRDDAATDVMPAHVNPWGSGRIPARVFCRCGYWLGYQETAAVAVTAPIPEAAVAVVDPAVGGTGQTIATVLRAALVWTGLTGGSVA